MNYLQKNGLKFVGAIIVGVTLAVGLDLTSMQGGLLSMGAYFLAADLS